MSSARGLFMVVALVVAACGDDGNGTPIDGPPSPIDAGTDAPIDAPPDAATLTTFVIDQILNHTANNTDPVPFATFGSLPDPDQSNPNAYAPLFP